ncbi:MAG: SGNH/GDSL hydrolase family protein [Armatimonadetes bacterium]|nr:SGNH/GDSL hydrolase family protein [Armatimonadota bacterium]
MTLNKSYGDTFGKKIFFSFIIILFFILFLELGTSLYLNIRYARAWKQNKDPLKRHYTQYSQARFYPFENQKVRINSMGFRGKEFRIPKDKNIFRIIILGGSAAFGIGASSDKKTIGGRLEEILNENIKSKHFEVYNMAIPGYISAQELITLQFYGIDFKPDLVIDINGFNDITVGMDYDNAPPDIDAHSAALINAYRALWETSFPKFLSYSLLRWSAFFKYVSDKIGKMKMINYYKNPETRKKIINQDGRIEFYIKNMNTLYALAEHYNFRLAVILQPALIYKNYLTSLELKHIQEYPASFNARQFYPEAAKIYFPIISRRMKMLDNNNKHKFLDFSHIFYANKKDIFIDIVHFTDLGNQIVAENIYEKILKPILKFK